IDGTFVNRVDAFSAPRLVEYFDEDPCDRRRYEAEKKAMAAEDSVSSEGGGRAARASALGVTILATYTVGEYDIEILSAKQSDGLETFLRESKYNIPKNAGTALAPYIRSGMKFFVAKVNLKEQAKTGFQTL